ncbi:MAG: 1,6-anhydro-N-acetylmuramyl-L-alanine amidase AmpD [Betaproteobacteria bacterium]|nr:MAG: 1,6-anhydro-N-acetylmuramyl-L-alanine amidase AmpD [Betaproteobacteria bacterium]TAG50193.1 MAG: 1,6-anhydro-N-acetylmuramyl-L-alanine amidase AmpD [Betaproteobacteria bacterium]
MTNSHGQWVDGWLSTATPTKSPNFDQRPAGQAIELVVLHHISLPANQFTGDAVSKLFLNELAESEEPTLRELATLRVSAHFFIRRDGALIQFVSVDDRAWHAGVSAWRGRSVCNDFSIGIEIEGNATEPFTAEQYRALDALLADIAKRHPAIAVTTHSEIAPGRKIDPGPTFDWSRLGVRYAH